MLRRPVAVVSPARIAAVADVEEHCMKLARLVCRLRRDRHFQSGGSLDFDCPKTAALMPTMREMGLDLGDTTGRAASRPSSPVSKPMVPSVGFRRGALFSKTSESTSQVEKPRASPTGFLKKISTQATNSNPSSKPSPKKLKPPPFAFVEAVGDEKIKSQCGMLRFMWENDEVLLGTGEGAALRPVDLNTHKPIEARFKQFYFDFIVEEIPSLVLDSSTPIVPLPRKKEQRNFSVPPIPENFMKLLGMQTTRQNIFDPVDVSAQLTSAMNIQELQVEKRGHQKDGLPRRLPEEEAVVELYNGLANTIQNKNAKILSSIALPRDSSVSQRKLYVQAVMRKRKLPHLYAMQCVAKALGVKPSKVSYVGIKDYNADTVQHIRVEGVSPEQMLQANKYFRNKGIRISLSDFSYHDEPLRTGYLTGNRFEITLRDVSESDILRLERNAKRVAEKGCLNYFGSQRFSSFGGTEDPMLAIIKGNWLLFAFRFLNYTDNPNLTFVQLLQRSLHYPTTAQNQYRHAIVRGLKRLHVEPTVLKKEKAFQKTPSGYDDNPFETAVQSMSGNPNRGAMRKPRLAYAMLKSAFFDIPLAERNISAQMLQSYYWNIVVSARYNSYGARVMVGDMVDTLRVRSLIERGDIVVPTVAGNARGEDTAEATQVGERYGFVTKENKHLFTMDDVVLPAFSLHNDALPLNRTAEIYHEVCRHHGLAWEQRVSVLRQFMRPTKRPMIVRPSGVTLKVEDASPKTVGSRPPGLVVEGKRFDAVVSFSLQKGSYASVVLSDILSLPHCTGADQTRLRPRPFATEWNVGRVDPKHVRTMESLYFDPQGSGAAVEELTHSSDEPQTSEGIEGDLNDAQSLATELPISAAQGSADVYSHRERDVSKDIAEWSSYHLVRNGIRNVQVDEEQRSLLFEKSLASQMKVGEVKKYIRGHHIPTSPGSNDAAIKKAISKRKRRYSFSSSFSETEGTHGDRSRHNLGPRVARRAQKKSYILRPTYGLQNVGTWNWK